MLPVEAGRCGRGRWSPKSSGRPNVRRPAPLVPSMEAVDLSRRLADFAQVAGEVLHNVDEDVTEQQIRHSIMNLDRNSFCDLAECQCAFDAWRRNLQRHRPREALGLNPRARATASVRRSFPEALPAIEYGPGDVVRKVDRDGFISFKNDPWRIGKAFRGQPVALRPTSDDGVFSIHYCTAADRQARFANRGPRRWTCGHRQRDAHNPTGATTATPLDALKACQNVSPMSPNTCYLSPPSKHPLGGGEGCVGLARRSRA